MSSRDSQGTGAAPPGSHAAISPDEWLVTFAPRPDARLRLFCFPYAGGGALTYREWPLHLPEHVLVTAVQPPGRSYRLKTPPFRRLDALADAIAETIRPELDLPFVFWGHSMGALVAFEVTRALRRRGLPLPMRLFASAYHAPHLPSQRPPIDSLDDAALVAWLRGLRRTPAEVLANPKLVALILPTLRADLEACESYVHVAERPLELPIAALSASDDREVTPERIDAWVEHTCGGFARRHFAGGHFHLETDPQALLAWLAGELSWASN